MQEKGNGAEHFPRFIDFEINVELFECWEFELFEC